MYVAGTGWELWSDIRSSVVDSCVPRSSEVSALSEVCCRSSVTQLPKHTYTCCHVDFVGWQSTHPQGLGLRLGQWSELGFWLGLGHRLRIRDYRFQNSLKFTNYTKFIKIRWSIDRTVSVDYNCKSLLLSLTQYSYSVYTINDNKHGRRSTWLHDLVLRAFFCMVKFVNNV